MASALQPCMVLYFYIHTWGPRKPKVTLAFFYDRLHIWMFLKFEFDSDFISLSRSFDLPLPNLLFLPESILA